MSNAISAVKLTKRYGDFTAVDGLDLSVEEGILYALLGVNGAGKTTTVKMLTGLARPDDGSASLLGMSPVDARAFTNVSPQETAVASNLTVRENLELTARIYGASKAEAYEAASREIKRLGLSSFEKKRAGKLSGGQARRLSIAMALITDPKILFLDEPTLGLDVLARRELWKIIRSLKGETTVILTTHYLEEAEALSDRIGIMHAGHLLAEGTAQELKAQSGTDNIEDAFIALCGEEAVLWDE